MAHYLKSLKSPIIHGLPKRNLIHSNAVAVKTTPKSKASSTAAARVLRLLALCSLRSVGKNGPAQPSCLRSGAGCSRFEGGRWASKLNSPGSFLARESFASATPFAVQSTACCPLLLPASGQPRPQTLPVSFVPHSTPGQARIAAAGVCVCLIKMPA